MAVRGHLAFPIHVISEARPAVNEFHDSVEDKIFTPVLASDFLPRSDSRGLE